MENSRVEECVKYFKSNSGFDRLFIKIKEKFKSIGKIGGKVCLSSVTRKEADAISGVLRTAFHEGQDVEIQVSQIQEALNKTKFDGVGLEELLFCYFQKEIVPNSEMKRIEHNERHDFFSRIANQFKGTFSGSWLLAKNQEPCQITKVFYTRYNQDMKLFEKDILLVMEALNHLPFKDNKKELLPVFASRITKNPHAFDEDTSAGSLLLLALSDIFYMERPRAAEEKAEIYYRSGILTDYLSSTVLMSGIRGFVNGAEHKGLAGFFEEQQPIIMPLLNLSGIDKLIASHDKVFVVENPAVFAVLFDNLKHENPSLLCTNGQPKLACLIALDLLCIGNAQLFYSGDFDPEGILIADRLKSRYNDKLTLWRYTKDDYNAAISKEKINSLRLKKFNTVTDEQLIKFSAAVRDKELAGYQENIIPQLIQDVMIEINFNS